MAKKITKNLNGAAEPKATMTADTFGGAMHRNISKIVGAYMLIMFAVFPLFMTNMYYNILTDKYYFAWYLTAAMLIAIGVAAVGGAIFDKKYFDGVNIKKFFAGFKFSEFKKKLILSDIFATIFIIVCMVSTIFSEWPFEAFWGNMGRYHGGFMCLWYFVAYVCISRFYEIKRWHIDIALLSGFLLCLWGIMDYFGGSFIGWHQVRTDSASWIFVTSIGNIDTATSVEGMYLMLAMIFYIDIDPIKEGTDYSKNIRTQRAKKLINNSNPLDRWITSNGVLTEEAITGLRKGYYFLCAGTAYMAMVANAADNALLTIGIALCFIPFYAFRNGRGIKRYTILLALFVGTMALLGMMTEAWEGQMTTSRGVLSTIATEHTKWMEIGFAGLLVFYVVLSLVLSDGPTKYIRKIWGVLGVFAAAAVVYVVMDANSGKHAELYAPIKNIIIFNEKWGSGRGYVWKDLVFKHMKEFPLFKQLFGTGPETFGIITNKYDYYEMIEKTGVVFDSPHSEPLQHLFNTGILGFLSYYGLVISTSFDGFKLYALKKTETVESGVNEAISEKALLETRKTAGVALVFLVIGYSVQAVFNIVVPISLPLVIISISACAKLGRDAKIMKLKSVEEDNK